MADAGAVTAGDADACAKPATEAPARAAAPKRKRTRRNWTACTRCDSKHGMRYGYVEAKELKIVACDKCKTADMRDISRVCDCGSGKDKRYGVSGEQASKCFECKDEGMENKRPSTGTCACGSKKVRRFGTKASGVRSHCIECKGEDMLNLSLAPKRDESLVPATGVSGGQCDCGSGKTRRFGLAGGRRVKCFDCKDADMVNLAQKVCPCGSERQLRYAEPGENRATNCSTCKSATMRDLSKKRKQPQQAPVAERARRRRRDDDDDDDDDCDDDEDCDDDDDDDEVDGGPGSAADVAQQLAQASQAQMVTLLSNAAAVRSRARAVQDRDDALPVQSEGLRHAAR